MILKKLTLKNFKGLLAGVGIPEVVIDFDALSGGLIAIVGGNGMGKTTILDNLHPYRLMPYKLRKAAGWSPGAFSFYDQCCGEARKELDFEMAGYLYRSVVLIDADRRKQEAYLYRRDAISGSAAVWIPLNDGKTRTYDEAVEAVCGSPSLFFTSVFRSQGAKNLSDYTRGDIVGIVSELLNIDHIREQGRKAKEVADSLAASCSTLKARAEDLHKDLEGEPDVVARRDDLEQQVSSSKQALQDLDAQIQRLEGELRAADALVVSQQSDRQRLAEKRMEMSDLMAQRDEAQAFYNRSANDLTMEQRRVREACDQAVRRLETERAQIAQDLESLRQRFTKDKNALFQKVERCNKIKENSALIREAVEKEDALQEEILENRRLLDEANRALEKKRVEVQRVLTARQAIESDRRHLQLLEKQASGLTSLDCRADGSGWINEGCPLLTGALKAKNDALALSNKVADLEADLAPKLFILDEDQEAQEVAARSDLEKALAAAESGMKEAQRFTRLLPELEQAEVLLKDLTEYAAQMDADFAHGEQRLLDKTDAVSALFVAETGSAQDKVNSLDLRLAEVRGEADQRVLTFSKRIDAVNNEIKALSLALLDDAVERRDALSGALAKEKDKRPGLEGSINLRVSALGAVKAELDALAEKRRHLDSIMAEVSRVDANIADWRLLQKACSNDGIIALEIDDAGPSISAIANDLLKSCYGPRFSVRIETQAEKVNGGAKETFDITVFDAETNEPKSITEMSGGQVCWIEDALTRAICLFNINRSDRVFGTLFSDEKDGALDANRKQEFMAVKRRSLELGTHGREIFITQTPELLDLADGVIRLSAGKVEVG